MLDVRMAVSGDIDHGTAETKVYCSRANAILSRAEVKTGKPSDDEKTDMLGCIINEFKVLRKEDTRQTVTDEIKQMKQHFKNTMNGMLENVEKQLTSVIQNVDKQSDNMAKMRNEVKGQVGCIERQTVRVNSVEVQLEESSEREKLTQVKLIHMDAKKQKNNLTRQSSSKPLSHF